MAAHDYHDILPGYHADQILHDGCGECEFRASDLSTAIGSLDHVNFIRAKRRAIDWNTASGVALHISKAEVPLLRVLWAVHLQEVRQFERLL